MEDEGTTVKKISFATTKTAAHQTTSLKNSSKIPPHIIRLRQSLSCDVLSESQQHALDLFRQGHNMFLTGQGGTGKTRLIQHFTLDGWERNKKLEVTAMTGCASILLRSNAKTLHSWSGIKLGNRSFEETTLAITRNPRALQKWRSTEILVLDECSLLSRRVFEMLLFIASRTRLSRKIFGGMQVIFCGDFFQLPPIFSPDLEGSGEFCFQSPMWDQLFPAEHHVELRQCFRQKDPLFQEILEKVRLGQVDEMVRSVLSTRVLPPPEHTDVILADGKKQRIQLKPPKIFAVKRDVEKHNLKMYSELPDDGQEYTFPFFADKNCLVYIDTGLKIEASVLAECKALTAEIVDTELSFLQGAIITQKGLTLKVGCQVMLTINLDMEQELVNGSQGIVEGFVTINGSIVPEVRFYNGIKMPIKLHYWQSERIPTVVVGNIPLQLSWAVTIHKIQGATLPSAEMDVGRNVFECGQSYVGLSRVQSLDGLFLVDFNHEKIRAQPIVVEFYRHKFLRHRQDLEATPVVDEHEILDEEETEHVEKMDEVVEKECTQEDDVV